MKTKLSEEIKLIGILSLLIPTAVLFTLSPLWWAAEPIKVFAGYLSAFSGRPLCWADSVCTTR